MLNPATTNDLRNRALRTLSVRELEVGGFLLDDAWTLIRTRMSSVEDRLGNNPSGTFISLVVQVECAMVLRVLNNPDGKLQETIDDYTVRLDSSVSTGALYVSDAELTLLGSSGGSETAFTIRPTGTGPDEVYIPAQWYPF